MRPACRRTCSRTSSLTMPPPKPDRARSFNFVNFTGSVGGGQAIERAAAGTFTPLGLELGGKDPGYVRADANLDLRPWTYADGRRDVQRGQCCCGIERIYVHESLFDSFVENPWPGSRQLKLGNPLRRLHHPWPDGAQAFCPDRPRPDGRGHRQGREAAARPANFADDGGAYLAPQILVNVDHSMRVMKEEASAPSSASCR
jgi:acyl-CoA reductase-like NAD-dependent aldehyde dehydrogenase